MYWFPCLKNGTAYACGCGFHVCGCCSGQGKTGCPAANFSANHILTFCKRFNETGKATRFRYIFRFENLEKNFEKPLTNRSEWCIIIYVAERCDAEKNDGSLAQLGEHLPYKQRVIGSSPIVSTIGLVVQLVRTLPCHGRGRGFESHPDRQCGFSSSGRAPPCQGGGSEFEPRNPLQWRYSQVVRQGSATP